MRERNKVGIIFWFLRLLLKIGKETFFMSDLVIKNLHVNVEENEILKGLNLTIKQGEVHALMGPNGSGKSTLAYTLSGHPKYEVTDGEVIFMGEDLLDLAHPVDKLVARMAADLVRPCVGPLIEHNRIAATAHCQGSQPHHKQPNRDGGHKRRLAMLS